MESFARQTGKDTKQVMNDLLSYIIGFFDPEGNPVPGWRYGKEQNAQFHSMMMAYFEGMKEELKRHEWYDAWGDLFMELTPKGGARGQFFTPTDICDMMVETIVDTDAEPKTACGAFGKRVLIGDPAAGSSRNLLSAHARFIRDGKRKPYLVAEDIDLMCCKMSAVNMMVHGCFGEVVCHNTLSDPKGLLVGYLINEGMYPLPSGIPTIRMKNEPAWFLSLR